MSRGLISWLCLAFVLAAGFVGGLSAAEPRAGTTKFARFQMGDTVAFGMVEGENIRQLHGDLFNGWEKTDSVYNLSEVKLLVPTQPSQVIAMAGNYKSHLPGQSIAPQFQIVQPFFKSPSCLVPHEANIVLPADSQDVHFEAEMVIVIGKQARNVSRDDALDYVFGVTVGNDVSERVWQKSDVQWWRAKGSDTFGPTGPFIATGLDYDNLQLTLRVNGEVKQDESTAQQIHSVSALVSGISRYVTLKPGDLIFTGTPGKTSAIKPGDVVEVELEHVGVLRNPVVAEQ